ncbi:MarR family transcriptional regulator [Bacillus sp. JJ1521]|uniref:MarR family winged helix-turn-helix transcriptional regulator n=1 Tax=Bacillus sp. JJ1521 TaxID=3122957 RepID=UPI003000C5CA
MIEIDEKSQEFNRSVMLMRSFYEVQKNMMHIFQRTAVENGISIPQYTILLTIYPKKEMTQKSVGDKTFLPKSTLSQGVDGLVQVGLLDRKQLENNRREMLLSLTEKGESFIKKIHFQEGSVHQVFREVVDALTDKQYENLLETHQQIVNHIKEQK